MSIEDIHNAVLDFDEDSIAELVRVELDRGTAAKTVLTDGLIAALDEVGKGFSDGTMFVPEMLMAAETMKVGLDVLRPLLTGKNAMLLGTAVVGSVKGDMHDIGKNLVAMMVEGAGFKIIDLGVNVGPSEFIAATKKHDAGFVLMSALLTTTMTAMRMTTEAVKAECPSVSVIVGGAPVNLDFADAIGADGYADDAPGAVDLMRKLVQHAGTHNT